MEQDEEVKEVTTVSAPVTQQVVKQTRVVTPQVGAVRLDSPQKTYQTKKTIFRSYQIIWYILVVIEVLLAFRILLKLLGANAASGFANFIYVISGPFALPFAGILKTTVSSEVMIEWSTFIAMSVYAIIAYGVIAIFQLVKPTNPKEVEQTVDSQ